MNIINIILDPNLNIIDIGKKEDAKIFMNKNFKGLILNRDKKKLNLFSRWLLTGAKTIFRSQLTLAIGNDSKPYNVEIVPLCQGYILNLNKIVDKSIPFTSVSNFWKVFAQTFSGGIIFLDESNKIIDISQTTIDMFPIVNVDGIAMSRDALLNKNLFDFLPEFPTRNILQFIHTAKQNEYSEFVNDYQYKNKHLRLCVNPVYHKLSYRGSCLYIYNITEEVKKNEELKEKQDHLIRSEKMASIGMLAAGVAHEVNNPTSFISANLSALKEYVKDFDGYIELIQTLILMFDDESSGFSGLENQIKRLKQYYEKKELDFKLSDTKELIVESQEGTHRIRDIVQNMSVFLRQDEIDVQNHNINDCLKSTLKLVENVTKYKCEVRTHFGKIPEIRCNSGQINQVFMNIIINAAQSIVDSWGTIDIKTFFENNHVCIQIEDTGKGMTEEVKRKIFNPFFTTKPLGVGTGLGLSISYGIIECHNGGIELESTIGVGTKFKIMLPMAHVIKKPCENSLGINQL